MLWIGIGSCLKAVPRGIASAGGWNAWRLLDTSVRRRHLMDKGVRISSVCVLRCVRAKSRLAFLRMGIYGAVTKHFTAALLLRAGVEGLTRKGIGS